MNFWLDWIGIRKNPMAPSPKNKSMNPSVPTLFLFGTTGLGRAFQDWSKELQKRNDSDVVSIEGDHWFMLKSPNATNKAVLEWLNFDEKGGKFTHLNLEVVCRICVCMLGVLFVFKFLSRVIYRCWT